MPLDSLSITSPAIEALRYGRALIASHGLARGTLLDKDGKFCTVGALTRGRYYPLALDYLSRAIPADLCEIARWNDAPGRTDADVLAVYDRAIDIAISEALNGAI